MIAKSYAQSDLSYLAGFLDGQGSITIFQSSGRDCARIQANSTHREVLIWIKNTFGGHVNRKPNPHTKQVYTWTLWSHRAAPLLQECLPYLRIKRKQAKLFIAFTATRGTPGVRTPEDIVRRRFSIMERMKTLNAV